MNPLTFIAGLVGGVFHDWLDRRKDRREIERAVVENKIRLAQSHETHNQAWEMAALEGRDALLRRASFAAWSAPVLWAAVDPAGARRFFDESLGALPEWYIVGYLGITGAIWGIAELRSMGVMRGQV